MSTNYPSAIDTLTNPVAGDSTVTVSHAGQHTNANDAIEAIETKIGITDSTEPGSLDYKVVNSASINPGHKHTMLAGISDVDVAGVADGNVLIYDGASGKWKNNDTDAPDASTGVKGVGRLDVAPSSAVLPIFIGNNNTLSTAPTSGTNAVVDEASVTEAKTASKIPIRDANGDILVATTPTNADAASSKTYVESLSPLYYVASNNLLTSTDAAADVVGTSGAIVRATAVSRTGTYRVKFDLTHTAGHTATGKIYRNGYGYGTTRSNGGGPTTYSEDLFFVAGDLIQLYLVGDWSGETSRITNFRIYGDSTLTVPAAAFSALQ